jgi:acetyl-CoA carboxylase carboxyltransferase component
MEEQIMSNVGNAELLQASRDAVKKSNAYKRINRLFDENTFNEIDGLSKSGDHYAEVVTGFGTIDGCPAYVFAQNAEIDGGAMSKAQASKIKKIYCLAVKTGNPVIGIYDSIGGRLKEGADMLAAYGEILLGSNNLSGVVPQISLILGPCVGTSAMIAANADIVVMSDKAEFTIETNGENGSADAATKLGICHNICVCRNHSGSTDARP